MAVKSIGIRELKTHLSKYIRNVKSGGEIMVSERGKVVARIIPFNKRSKQPSIETVLLKLSEGGKIILPIVYKKPAPPLSRKKIKGSPFSDAVREGRR
jgi:prevent-host-death family protein